MTRTLTVPFWVAVALAVLAVAPLIPPVLAAGPIRFSLQPHPTLAPLLDMERPLTIRPFAGWWAMLAVLAWFALAYRSRRQSWWEIALVIAGSVVALARLGNVWLLAAALAPPLARQLSLARLPLAVWLVSALALAGVSVYSVQQSRPRALSHEALSAATASQHTGTVFAALPWASDLQARLGGGRQVLGAGDPWASPPELWTDYFRVSHGHLTWQQLLQRHSVDLVVLDEKASQERAARFVRRPDSGWRVLHDHDGVVVAERLPG